MHLCRTGINPQVCITCRSCISHRMQDYIYVGHVLTVSYMATCWSRVDCQLHGYMLAIVDCQLHGYMLAIVDCQLHGYMLVTC